MKIRTIKTIPLFLILGLFACKQTHEEEPKTQIPAWIPYDESAEIAENTDHESQRMQYKLIQSKVTDRNDIWKNVADQIAYFSEEDYERLKPFILEQDILSIQSHIKSGKLSYETLTQWYLYRIVKYENDSTTFLNAIIAINPNAVQEARKRDENKSENDHPIYGMPILVKDNINFAGLPTTAGSVALQKNITKDAFIVEKIKENGGIILGKVNLSEWANFLSIINPNGYSAMGGQTLNPYGRRKYDTGGSSSASGVAMAANYAAAAIGTETSGSILSPSSSNSIVGLKPTVGLFSRAGIVPISSTLDTPGPMTRNVTDNAILASAMSGEDPADVATKDNPKNIRYWEELQSESLEGVRFGVNKSFLSDSVYGITVDKIKAAGGVMIEFEPENMDFEGFATLLSADMKIDLPDYLSKYASKEISFKTVDDVVVFNNADSLIRIPYGQGRLDGILETNLSVEEHEKLKESLNTRGIDFFEKPMKKYDLDAVLSINNWNAGNAAAAKYPCLTVPMGYNKNGAPIGLTFITRPFEERKLLKLGYAFEQLTKSRKLPKGYR
ncbi:MAG: amidase family protein [Bacteroidota bacterium]